MWLWGNKCISITQYPLLYYRYFFGSLINQCECPDGFEGAYCEMPSGGANGSIAPTGAYIKIFNILLTSNISFLHVSEILIQALWACETVLPFCSGFAIILVKLILVKCLQIQLYFVIANRKVLRLGVGNWHE